MRFPFTIAISAARSAWAELKEAIHAHRLCLFCDLPWICLAALVYLGKTCLFHRARRARANFLDREPEPVCNCPHCVRSRIRRAA